MTYVHGALDATAWTDFVSNTTSLLPGSEEDDPRPWLGWGQARAAQLSAYLHESTHHWCFVSPVAFAVAGLILRARTGILRAIAENKAPDNSIVNDLVRAETALALLRPLAEGLALFAEFDAISKIESKAISPVMQSLVQFFLDPQRAADLLDGGIPGDIAIPMALSEVIAELRTSPATLDRKASLLLKPFSLQAGGYLPGYLAVKSLWRAASRKHFALATETDWFLMYLRSYVYDDWGMVVALLAPERDEIRSASRVVSHLNSRLSQWELLTADDFVAYELSVAAPRDSDELALAGLGIDARNRDAGRRLLRNLMKELMATDGVSEEHGLRIARWHSSFVVRRHFMNVAAARVDLIQREGDACDVRWKGETILTTTADDVVRDVRSCSGAADLEIVVSLLRNDRFTRAAVVYRGGAPLICSPIGLRGDAEATRKEVVADFIDRHRITQAENAMGVVVKDAVQNSWFRIATEHCKGQVDRILDDFYKDVSLRFARDYEAIDTCADLMVHKGFKPVLGTTALVRGLALIGLLTSLNPATSFVAEGFEQNGLSLPKTLRELADVYESRGYPPRVIEGGGLVFTTV